jgi:hypothetical protein
MQAQNPFAFRLSEAYFIPYAQRCGCDLSDNNVRAPEPSDVSVVDPFYRDAAFELFDHVIIGDVVCKYTAEVLTVAYDVSVEFGSSLPSRIEPAKYIFIFC